MNRKEFILQCREKKMTWAEIGKLVNVSGQRVHQIATGYDSPSHYPPITILPEIHLEKVTTNGESISKLTGLNAGSLDRIRELVRQRDNHTCQICFLKWNSGARKLDVHHLDEEMESTKNCKWDKEHSDRMVTLCHKCHLRLDHLRKKFINIHKKLSPNSPLQPPAEV